MARDARRSRAARIITILKDLFPTPISALHWSKPYEYLFAVIMSAQTTDVQVNKVNAGLFLKYRSLDDFIGADPTIFAADMSAINLYKNKAKYIQQTARILRDQYDGKVPDTMEALIKLPDAGSSLPRLC
jgi:endonuclease-3